MFAGDRSEFDFESLDGYDDSSGDEVDVADLPAVGGSYVQPSLVLPRPWDDRDIGHAIGIDETVWSLPARSL